MHAAAQLISICFRRHDADAFCYYAIYAMPPYCRTQPDSFSPPDLMRYAALFRHFSFATPPASIDTATTPSRLTFLIYFSSYSLHAPGPAVSSFGYHTFSALSSRRLS